MCVYIYSFCMLSICMQSSQAVSVTKREACLFALLLKQSVWPTSKRGAQACFKHFLAVSHMSNICYVSYFNIM